MSMIYMPGVGMVDTDKANTVAAQATAENAASDSKQTDWNGILTGVGTGLGSFFGSWSNAKQGGEPQGGNQADTYGSGLPPEKTGMSAGSIALYSVLGLGAVIGIVYAVKSMGK